METDPKKQVTVEGGKRESTPTQDTTMETKSEYGPAKWAQWAYYKSIHDNIQAHLHEGALFKKRRRGSGLEGYISGAERYAPILQSLYQEMDTALKEDLVTMA